MPREKQLTEGIEKEKLGRIKKSLEKEGFTIRSFINSIKKPGGGTCKQQCADGCKGGCQDSCQSGTK